MEFTKSSLIKYIIDRLETERNIDITVSNIRMNDETKVALADVSYIWFLNATEHYTKILNWAFMFSEENKEWKSADFWE